MTLLILVRSGPKWPQLHMKTHAWIPEPRALTLTEMGIVSREREGGREKTEKDTFSGPIFAVFDINKMDS